MAPTIRNTPTLGSSSPPLPPRKSLLLPPFPVFPPRVFPCSPGLVSSLSFPAYLLPRACPFFPPRVSSVFPLFFGDSHAQRHPTARAATGPAAVSMPMLGDAFVTFHR